MTEILFRGRNENGKWFYGYVVKGNYNTGFGIIEDHIDTGLQYVEERTIGQFTGLTDRNGKKIFEGDIVKEKDILHNGKIQIKGAIFKVRVLKGCWAVVTEEFWDYLYRQKDLEVIGNIHDNPELLGE